MGSGLSLREPRNDAGNRPKLGDKPLAGSTEHPYTLAVDSVPTQFEWHQDKAESNLAKHGVSFDVAIAAFADRAHRDLATSRASDGEERGKVVGVIEGRLITVVYTMRGRVCRL